MSSLRLSSCDFRAGAPGVRFLYYATFEPELREYDSFTTLVLQSCDFRAGAPGVRFLYYACTTKLRLSSRSSGSTIPLLRLYYKVATFAPELREYDSFTTLVLQSCDFRAGAPGVRFLYYACTTKLRLSRRSSGSTIPLLRLYYKVATFEPELREYDAFTLSLSLSNTPSYAQTHSHTPSKTQNPLSHTTNIQTQKPTLTHTHTQTHDTQARGFPPKKVTVSIEIPYLKTIRCPERGEHIPTDSQY